ncbi:MAG: hypothetical protein PVF08_08460 [Gammaproteobacteria bacterium]
MTDFVEIMRLAEKAQEDIYFAKLNRELIDELHRRAAAEAAGVSKASTPENFTKQSTTA